jgi:hypothetical protein
MHLPCAMWPEWLKKDHAGKLTCMSSQLVQQLVHMVPLGPCRPTAPCLNPVCSPNIAATSGPSFQPPRHSPHSSMDAAQEWQASTLSWATYIMRPLLTSTHHPRQAGEPAHVEWWR